MEISEVREVYEKLLNGSDDVDYKSLAPYMIKVIDFIFLKECKVCHEVKWKDEYYTGRRVCKKCFSRMVNNGGRVDD